MPLFLNGVGGTLWSTTTRKTITSTCAVIVAISGAIAAIKAEASDIEYVIPAHRGYVRWYIDDRAAIEIKNYKLAQAEVQRTISHIQHDINDGKRETAQNDLFKAGLEMKKAVKAGDDDTQQYIQKEVIRLQVTLEKLDVQKKTLNQSGN